jgi:hypothetical protein
MGNSNLKTDILAAIVVMINVKFKTFVSMNTLKVPFNTFMFKKCNDVRHWFPKCAG